MGRKQQRKKPHKPRLRIDAGEARKLLKRDSAEDTDEQEIIFDLPRPQRLTLDEEKQLCAKCGHERRAHHAQECVGGWQRDRTDWPRCTCTTYLFEPKPL